MVYYTKKQMSACKIVDRGTERVISNFKKMSLINSRGPNIVT